MSNTAKEMRALAAAVERKSGGAGYQPILPKILREWAYEIDHLYAEREAMQEMFPARPGVLREALERKRRNREP